MDRPDERYEHLMRPNCNEMLQADSTSYSRGDMEPYEDRLPTETS